MREIRLKIAAIAVLIGATFAATPGYSGTAAAGNVTRILVQGNGLAQFSHTGARSGAPGCATSPTVFSFNASTAPGQALLSMLMTAYVAGKRLVVYGANTCSTWGNIEDAYILEMTD